MLIQDHLGPQHLGHQRTEDQNVRHVVDVDQVIAAFQRAPGQDAGGGENECGILVGVREFAAAPVLDGQAAHIEPVRAFASGGLVISEADEVTVIPSFNRASAARRGRGSAG